MELAKQGGSNSKTPKAERLHPTEYRPAFVGRGAADDQIILATAILPETPGRRPQGSPGHQLAETRSDTGTRLGC